MHHVYVIKSKDHDRYYIGITSDLTRRINEHNSGKTRSTKGYKPWDLYYFEEYATRQEARQREKYLKSGEGREYIRNLKAP